MSDATSMPSLPRCGEWIGALVTFPSYVTGEGAPFKPTAVMWLEPETGWIVDSQLVRPEEALPRAAGLFHLATREPQAGDPRKPARVRVSDEVLAHALRGSLGDTEVIVAPTPEVDDVVASLTAHLEQRDRDDAESATYLGPDLEPADVASVFGAAAQLYRAQPWQSVPADSFISVTCDRLGITDGALCVVGQMGESFGFSLFRSIDDAKCFLDAVEAGERSGLPAHYLFTFDDHSELSAPLMREIEGHGWEVAGPRAYPTFVHVDEQLVARGMTPDEHAGMAAVASALAELVETEPALDTAWETDERIEYSAVVETARGEIRVTVAAPLWLGESSSPEFEGAPECWSAVLDPDGELDYEMFEAHFDALMSRFEAAPEASEEKLPIAEMLVEHTAMAFGATIVGLSPPEVEQLLFAILPNQVAIDADAAPLIIETMRGLLTFAERELGSITAAAGQAVLGPDAVTRLARELADERNFGVAKSLLVQGAREGYDMTSEAGIAAFVAAMDQRSSGGRKRAATPTARAKSAAKPKAKAKAKSVAKPKVKAKPVAKPKAKAKAKAKAGAKTAGKPRAKAPRAKPAATPKRTGRTKARSSK